MASGTACLPALRSLASALGLGFFSHFEGIAVNTLLPIFASLELLVNLYNWHKNKNHTRAVFSILGPVAVLLTLYPLWLYDWSTYLFYFGICLMVVMSVLDIVKPVREQTCNVWLIAVVETINGQCLLFAQSSLQKKVFSFYVHYILADPQSMSTRIFSVYLTVLNLPWVKMW